MKLCLFIINSIYLYVSPSFFLIKIKNDDSPSKVSLQTKLIYKVGLNA
jgi:hypothetical protein